MGYHEITALVICVGSIIALAIGLTIEARRPTRNRRPS